MGLAHADYYRSTGAPKCEGEKPVRKTSRRALSKEEHDRVLPVLYEERFMNKPPSAVYATLLDEGVTSAPSELCTAYLKRINLSKSGAINCDLLNTKSQNCWRLVQIKSGVGTSPS